MNEPAKRKLYRAIFWTADPAVAGRRVQVYAFDAEEAAKLLRDQYGTENTYSIWNDEDAERPRKHPTT